MLSNPFASDATPALHVIPETDEALAARASIDEAALAELYRRHVGAVYRFCLLRLNNRQLAEDCTSEIFTRVVSAIDRFQPDRFRGWLFTIARNEVTNVYRQNRTTFSLDVAEDVSSSDDIEAMTEQSLALQEVARHLSALTPDQRAVIELRFAGLTGQEIAVAMNRNDAWVHTTQYRAIRALKSRMVPPPGGLT